MRRIAEENNISLLTSFRLRHKVLYALKKFIESINLSWEIQSDEKYFSINLKETKPENMPRYSKKRTSTSSPYRGISHHKICIVSSVDAIPSVFHNDGMFNISEINGRHSQLETWLSKFRGVSTRHLQEYLDWFVYIFIIKKDSC